MTEPKILFFDIETAPNLGYVWGKWEQNVIDYTNEWYVLCYSAKWLGGKNITNGLPDYPGYKPGSQNDKKIVEDIWSLFNEADIIVAHNGDQFDIKKMNARFLFHKLTPPTPYKTIDTKKVAKRYFSFNSNKLDDLGQHLGLGRKVKHEGFEMWQGCMAGDMPSWRLMKKYNQQDVNLLEKVYLYFRGWISSHPILGMFSNGSVVCPKCGSSKLQARGFAINSTTKYRRFQCRDCGGWGRTTQNLNKDKPLVNA